MARPPRPGTFNEDPIITANELAKFMTQSFSGQIGTIKKAVYSTPPRGMRYSSARRAIKNFLTSEHRDMDVLHRSIHNLQEKIDAEDSTAFIIDDAEKSIAAIESFVRLQNQLGRYDYTSTPHSQPPLPINGVQVKVTLDLLIHRTHRNIDQVGGTIYRFTQADDETPAAENKRRDIGRYAATLAHLQVAQNLAGNRNATRQLSMAVDVQFGEVLQCPPRYAQRVQNLENACRFIASMWDELKEEVRADLNP